MHKVLIIDDEKDICFLISEILKDENYNTSIALNSDEAISKFNEIKPDLVILDVWLSNSKLDGIEILKEFMEENAKGFANTKDFFKKVDEKTNDDYWYFAEQYFYTPNQPKLEHYQTDNKFFYRWNNVNDNFKMPIDLLVNGKEKRVNPKTGYQSFPITKHSKIEVMDWKFYVQPSEISK